MSNLPHKFFLFIFIVLITLIASLLYFAYRDVSDTYLISTKIIQEQQLKRTLLTNMYNAARERSLILLRMFAEYDDFALDDLNQALGEQARVFIKSREQLLSMGLDGKELALLLVQYEATLKNAPLQDQVAQLFIDGERVKARRLLFEKALPGQDIVLQQFEKVFDGYARHAQASVLEFKRKFDKSTDDFKILASLLFIFGLLSLVVFMTRISRREEILLRQTAEASQQASIAKSQFLATMSHEIRTPMNAMLGMAQLLEDTPLNDEQRDYLATLNHSGNGLLSIINDILDFSKLEAEKLQLEKIPFDLENLCLECLELFSATAAAKGLDLVFVYQPQCPSQLRGDPVRIRQIILNLISNAIKFTEQGYVCCAVSCSQTKAGGATLTIEIDDSGIGLEEQAVDHLFDEFSQADQATTRRFGGTGLGLAICKKLVDLMDGKLIVDSQIGRGSSFSFKLHLAVVAPPEITQRAPLEGIRVLLVDDISECRHVFSSLLQAMKMDVDVVRNAHQVIDRINQSLAEARPYQIVIFDQRGPDDRGLETGIKIRQRAEFSDIKLMMMASIGQKAHAGIFRKAGFDAYLSKLSTRNSLSDVLTNMIEQDDRSLITQHSIEQQQSHENQPQQTFNASVLLVEDVLPNQIIARKFLTVMGVSVDVANDGQQGLEACQKTTYDLIFMDCLMPVMDGYEATRKIRQMETIKDKQSKLPIIALTANASKQDEVLCYQAGMNDVIIKPFKRQALADCLHRWIPHKKVDPAH